MITMRKSLFIFFFLCFNLVAYTQVIRGTVLDQNTKDTIYSASFYFNGTSAGALSDSHGAFVLDVTKYPSMPLTVSALGYYSTTVTDFKTGKPLTVYLKPKIVELNEVVVNAKSHSWERKENMVIFRSEFLGKTSNSLNCVITNESDIRFIYNTSNDTIVAYAIKPLMIENRNLGYKITYYLDKFLYCKESSTFSFTGNMIFHEDSTLTESQKQVVERRREKAYLGSRMHFMRALWVNDLNTAGFTVKNTSNETLSYEKIVTHRERIKYLSHFGDLGIAYYSTKVPTSYIAFLKTQVYFDANGYYDPSGISWDGEMANKRIADMLPYDYRIKE
jgi:hypothetical protein